MDRRRAAADAASRATFSLRQALQWIERLGAKRAILTHMTFELDYEALRRDLPPHVEPAYDGMVVHVP